MLALASCLALLVACTATQTNAAGGAGGGKVATRSGKLDMYGDGLTSQVRMDQVKSIMELKMCNGSSCNAEAAVHGLAFAQGAAGLLAVGAPYGDDNLNVLLINAAKKKKVAELQGNSPGDTLALAFSDNGRRVAANAVADMAGAALYIWDTDTDAGTDAFIVVSPGYESSYNTSGEHIVEDCFSVGLSNGGGIAAWGCSGTVASAEGEEGADPVHSYDVVLVHVKNRMAVQANPNDVNGKPWCSDGSWCTLLTGHQGDIMSIAFPGKGALMASGSDDTNVILWNTTSKMEVARLQGHNASVHGLAFSRNGRRLASGSHDMTVRVWDVASGNELAVLLGHEAPVDSVSWGSHGLLASSDQSGRVILWGGEPLEALQVLQVAPQRGTNGWLFNPSSPYPGLPSNPVSFSKSGSVLAVASGVSDVQLFAIHWP